MCAVGPSQLRGISGCVSCTVIENFNSRNQFNGKTSIVNLPKLREQENSFNCLSKKIPPM